MQEEDLFVFVLCCFMGLTVGLIMYELRSIARQEKWFDSFFKKMKGGKE